MFYSDAKNVSFKFIFCTFNVNAFFILIKTFIAVIEVKIVIFGLCIFEYLNLKQKLTIGSRQ